MASQAEPMSSPLTTICALTERLLASRDFEMASSHLLDAVFPVIAEAARATAADARLLRATIHYRPEDGYRRLWGKESGATEGGVPPLQLPSLTAWRWVARRGCPVSIDAEARLMRVFEGGHPRLLHAQDSLSLDAGQTCQRLQERDSNYLYAIPLRAPGNRTDGMLCLELRCQPKAGDALLASCGAVLQLLVDLAAPHIAALPHAPAVTQACPDAFLPVVGKEMASRVDLLRVFANLTETILISGPTGVGKSRLARYCHEHSPRNGKPFVTLDLLACPEDLQMAQLVGWKRGAFTGADRDSPGAVQRAQGGTLFLDEIDKLSLQAQAGLLRLVEDRVCRPVGDSGEDRKADVRFIVGTNANLRRAAEAGTFRNDLYWRIAVLMVRVPPLAERLDEVPGWAEYMLARCHQAARASTDDMPAEARLDDDAATILMTQPWPGNLRQLDNVIRRAYAYSLLKDGHSDTRHVVSKAHVQSAVAEDGTDSAESGQPRALADELRSAARAFAREVKRRAGSAAPLDLACTEAFRGLVLEATVDEFAQRKEDAFEALGLENVVKDRNHHRMIKRESEVVARMLAVLGGGRAG